MNAPSAIGIDIGGTKMAVAVVDGGGQIVARATLPTEAAAGFDRAVERLIAAIASLCAQTNHVPATLAGIGIGCAGPVDPARGLINNPYTLEGWDRCDIVGPLRERFHVPVVLENDADAAAYGECRAGAGRGADPVVMLTFGTGIGGATVLGGRIHRGVHGEHPELGHLPVEAGGPPCYCGHPGCLEAIASGSALGDASRRLGLADARALFAAADRLQPAAVEAVERATAAAATAAWTIAHTLLPQRLVLGGGIMETEFTRFSRAMNRRLAAATQFTRGAIEIVPARLGNDAGVVGAAAWVIDTTRPHS